MMDDLLSAYGSRFLVAALGVALALLLLFIVLWLLRNRAPSPFVRGGRNRQPRLQVLDAAAIDARRRIVLIRRDNVEHLVMIGGPTDLVIESGIGDDRSFVNVTPAVEQPMPDQIQPAADKPSITAAAAPPQRQIRDSAQLGTTTPPPPSTQAGDVGGAKTAASPQSRVAPSMAAANQMPPTQAPIQPAPARQQADLPRSEAVEPRATAQQTVASRPGEQSIASLTAAMKPPAPPIENNQPATVPARIEPAPVPAVMTPPSAMAAAVFAAAPPLDSPVKEVGSRTAADGQAPDGPPPQRAEPRMEPRTVASMPFATESRYPQHAAEVMKRAEEPAESVPTPQKAIDMPEAPATTSAETSPQLSAPYAEDILEAARLPVIGQPPIAASSSLKERTEDFGRPEMPKIDQSPSPEQRTLSDFERVLEEEMALHLSSDQAPSPSGMQRTQPPPTVMPERPAIPVAAVLPQTRSDPLTGLGDKQATAPDKEEDLQNEIAKIFGEMSATRN